MKKLNKLLMPIVGLSTIVAGTIPMVGCNKTTPTVERVTEAEWKNAIDFLLGENEEQPYWYTSEDDHLIQRHYPSSTATKEDVSTWTNVIYNAGDYYADAEETLSTREKTSTYKEHSKLVNNFNYNMDIVNEGGKARDRSWSYYMNDRPAIDATFLFLRTAYNSYADFTYNEENKTYSYSLDEIVLGDDIIKSLTTNIKMNSDKKIASFFTTFEVWSEGESRRDDLITIDLHLNYGKKEIAWPELMNERIAQLTFSDNDTGSVDVKGLSNSSSYEGAVITLKAPSAGLNKIKIVDKATPATKVEWLQNDVNTMIVKNGSLLVDTYTIDTANGIITLNDALSAGDVINLFVFPGKGVSDSKTYTFSLANA